ncbi:dynamin-related protein 4C-like [Fagus crenata]
MRNKEERKRKNAKWNKEEAEMRRQDLQKEESGLFQPTQPALPLPLGTDSVNRDERALEGLRPGNAAPALVPQREREELAWSIHRAVGESFNVPVLNKGSSTLHQHEEEYSLELPEQNAPIFASYNDRIRPLLDAVDSLRDLKITEEDIQLPTIVVVGDQSSGKSSVLESLVAINLPRGLGICTRVPLIMRLHHQPLPQPELVLKFKGKVVKTDEVHVSEAIKRATDEIAGPFKGISDVPLTLEVRKNGVPDLTMIDLPGISRVPVHGQPDNIYDQIRKIIMEYITPEESIILNVLSATVDFTTCESIRMSKMVDKSRNRTLAVVTKSDMAPEGLLEKVTADDVNIGLGYVCVRNRIGDESYEVARVEEAKLFETHPMLSKIDKSMVGVPVLAQKLVQIQEESIAKNLPEIVKSINEKLNLNVAELKGMPKKMSSLSEKITVFMQIIGSAKESLRKILLRGEFDEYPDEKKMHCTARLVELLDQYSDELHTNAESNPEKNFLMEEIMVLKETKGIWLPNFLPRTAFLTVHQRKVNGISSIPTSFAKKVWNYVEEVVISVIMRHSDKYHQLQLPFRRAGQNLIAKMKEHSVDWVMEIVEMEKLTDYTCNPEYLSDWNKLMSYQHSFLKAVLPAEEWPSFSKAVLPKEEWPSVPMGAMAVDSFSKLGLPYEEWSSFSKVWPESFGKIEVEKLRQFRHVLPQAFDMKMRMTAYWKIVLRRLVDCMALHLQLSVSKLVNKEFEKEIVDELMGASGGIERMLDESPTVNAKRLKITERIELLQKSKEVVAKITDLIGTYAD